MQKVDYHRYMASREWALKKEAVKERSGDVCERCHEAKVQSVHHLTYERLGNETTETDLVGVCRLCHEFLSGKRDDDPAIIVVGKLIEATGLEPALMHDGDWESLMEWSTGPTAQGRCFHGRLLPTGDPEERWWFDFKDDTQVIFPLGQGVWYHCNSY